MPRSDGSPTIADLLGRDGDAVYDRSDKPWPPDQDCKGCDKHQDGPHRFGCLIHGRTAHQLTVTFK